MRYVTFARASHGPAAQAKGRRRFARLVVAASLLLGSAAGLMAAEPAGGLAWKQETDSLALVRQGQVLWQFNYGTNLTKAFFHPLALPGGPVLTAKSPADHPWHRGLWFSWKYLNHLNYWEEDPKTGVAQGRTQWEPPTITTRPEGSARIVMAVVYRPPGEPPLLKEQREITVSPPEADGSYHVDWAATFTAQGQDVVLDRTPLLGQPRGAVNGGYAGLSVRLATTMKDPQADAGEGPGTFKSGRYRAKAPAMDYSGIVDDREAGIAIVDNSANLNSPSPWYAIADGNFRFFTPAVIANEPHTLKAGETFSLRYRVIVHAGRWNAERLRQAVAKYNAEATH